MWPGFRDNMRVLRWIVERSNGQGRAHEGPLGWIPNKEDLDWAGLDFSDEKWEELMKIDTDNLRCRRCATRNCSCSCQSFFRKKCCSKENF